MQYNISGTQCPNGAGAEKYIPFFYLVTIAVHELMAREEVDAYDESCDIYGYRYGIFYRCLIDPFSGLAAIGTAMRRASWAICRLRHGWAGGAESGRQYAGDRL